MDDYEKLECDYGYKEPYCCTICDTYFINKCDCNQFVKYLRWKKDEFFDLFKKKDPEAPF